MIQRSELGATLKVTRGGEERSPGETSGSREGSQPAPKVTAKALV